MKRLLDARETILMNMVTNVDSRRAGGPGRAEEPPTDGICSALGRCRPSRGALGAAGLFLVLLTASCGPRLIEENVFQSEEIRVFLRKMRSDGEIVPRGYSHPTTIADVRLAHILANLSHEDAGGKRQPTIRSAQVYPLAEALNQAVGRAGPDDTIVAVVTSRDPRLALFTDRKVTAFQMFFQDDTLALEFFDIEHDVEPGPNRPGRDDGYTVPQSLPEAGSSFRVLAGTAQVAAGRRALRIAWRDDFFAKPVSLSMRGGRFRRRTVLMESEPPQDRPVARPELPVATDLSPKQRDVQMRALDELEALRRSGLIPEAEYQRRLGLIRAGRLEDAGYDAADTPAEGSQSADTP